MRRLPPAPLRLATLAGAMALALASLPGTADAQFGIMDRAKRKVEEAAARKVVGERAGGERGPAFNDRVLEITGERVDQLVRGLKAEVVVRDREAAAERAAAARQEAAKAFEARAAACARKYEQEGQQLALRMTSLMYRAQAEAAGGKGVKEATSDSLSQVTRKMETVQARAQAECGASAAGGDAQFAAATGPQGSDPIGTGARASGLGQEQYAILRERACAWLHARDGRTGQYVYTAGERDVLKQRATELGALRRACGAGDESDEG